MAKILPNTAIVDSGAFWEANFFRYVIEIFSFGFFYSLNVVLSIKGRAAFSASLSNAMLGLDDVNTLNVAHHKKPNA